MLSKWHKNEATAMCLCGSVEIKLKTDEPALSGFCHCWACRRAHSAPLYQVIYADTANISPKTGDKREGEFEIMITKGFDILRPADPGPGNPNLESFDDNPNFGGLGRLYCSKCGVVMINTLFKRPHSVFNDTDEDVELAQAKLQEVSSQTQDSLNRFNDDNVEYQAKLQKDIQDAQLTDSNEAKKLQKYSAELQQYQADVAKEVQVYQQNLEGDLRVWQAERQTDLQKYGSDIQNNLNTFNKENVKYQALLQQAIQEVGLVLQKENQEYAAKLQKYGSEVQN